MDLGIKGKVAFVAASSQGLGKAVAMELANEGVNLIICSRNESELVNTKSEIQNRSKVDVLAIVGDLTIQEDREKMMKDALNQFGHIDILVTNTGGPPSGKFEELSQKDWDTTYELLLGSAVHMIRMALPGMKKQQWGRILAITSQAVKQPVDNLILSNSVRASVAGLVKSLANELGAYNITVNNVMPGYTKTNRLMQLIEKNPELNSATKEIPLKRFAQPEEFGSVVTFLASEKASYITGTSLAVDGGWIKGIV